MPTKDTRYTKRLREVRLSREQERVVRERRRVVAVAILLALAALTAVGVAFNR